MIDGGSEAAAGRRLEQGGMVRLVTARERRRQAIDFASSLDEAGVKNDMEIL